MGWIGTKKYVAISVLAAAAAVWHAFSSREQFFPAMLYLSSSKFSVAILGNLGFALALSLYKVITTVFLGSLRDSEVERINDKISQAVLETCLAMTIFRTDFTVSVMTMFVILSFVKIFHWLVQDRVDFIETTPTVSRLQHLRIVAFMGFLLVLDSLFLQYTLSRTLVKGVSVHLLFAFEFAIQASAIVTTFVKYVLSMVDLAMEGRWEGKGVAVFYLELTLDLLHLMVYAAFFAVVFSHYGVPLYLVRDLWFTFRNFTNRLRDFLRYRRITANMDQRFPDATPEDLARADNVCIICREELQAGGRNKKLRCNHVFHMHCLRSWLERQQSCPICRTSVQPPDHPHHGHPQPPPPGVPGQQGPLQEPQRGQQHAAAGERQPAPAPAAAAAAGGVPAGFGDPAAAGGGWRVVGAAGPHGVEILAQAQPGRRRGNRAYSFTTVPAAGVAAGGGRPYDPHQAVPAHLAGYVVNQWVPATSMALFVPGGGLPAMQYAGQQNPADVAAAQAQAPLQGIVPVLPIVLPQPMPLPAGLATAGAAATSEAAAAAQQQQAAAAAAAAAAAVSMMSPGTPVMMPQQPPTALGSNMMLQQMIQQQMDALAAQLAALRQQSMAQQAASAPAPAVPHPAPTPPLEHSAAAGPSSAAPADVAAQSPAGPAASAPAATSSVEGAAATTEGAAAEPAEDDAAAELRRRRLSRFAQQGEAGGGASS